MVGLMTLPVASARKSDGEKPSGLLRWESGLAFERGALGALLRTGRIHAGRVLTEGSSDCAVGSKGICVTETDISLVPVKVSNVEPTPAEFLHEITGALATYVSTAEPAQKPDARTKGIEAGRDKRPQGV